VTKRILILLTFALLAACASPPQTIVANPSQRFQPVKLTAVGYGATTPYDSYTPGQKRLMAMRASKLDAYRALVEQAYGVRVTSNSTVAALVAQHDSFRVYVDAYVRGATVLTVTPMAEGNYETVMELELSQQFFENSMRFQTQNATPAPVQPLAVPNCSARGGVAPGCGYGTNFYYSE
jgi:outer membrane protein FlgP